MDASPRKIGINGMKRIIIAGSRDLPFRKVWRVIDREMQTVYPNVSTILCGTGPEA